MDEKSPFDLGYRMPAEWEEHEGTWIAWPKDPLSFPDEILPEVENTYLDVIAALKENEKVNLLVDDERYERKVTRLFDERGISGSNIVLHRIRTSDVWFRDYGPIFVKSASGEIAFTHWKFNAWGNKYEELLKDTTIPERIPIGSLRRFDAPMVLEGGSIDVNGLGTCLTTEQCLLNKNRNPGLGRQEIERNLRDYLGATNVIWLKEGIVGDDTDGHIDDIARFVDRKTVVCAYESSKDDENYAALAENYEILKRSVDQDGKSLKVLTLPMPKPVVYNGQRLPASYTNFYIANKKVLLPIFNDENDRAALETLRKAFPERKVVGINCRALAYGFGTIHCTTQQQPAPNKKIN